MEKPLKVLISGSGIAGSVFARCLLHAYKDVDITIVERAPGLRLTGASVDVRSSGVDIIKWMGVEPEIRRNSTNEKGTAFVRGDGSTIAYFGATGNSDFQGMTSEYEICRGALAQVFIEPILDKVKLIYDETVEKYKQSDEQVHVTFKSQRQESFDLLVAADGLGSRIRGSMLGAPSRQQIHDRGARVAFFSATKDLLAGSQDGKWRSLPGGRGIYLRPDPEGFTRCHFIANTPEAGSERRAKYDKALANGNESFMQVIEEEFKDGDWLTAEVLKEMRKTEDFYCSLFAQVRSPKLVDGRVALMGDAGYACPGIGTSLAITGGYVLAGELLKNSGDVSAACKRYEDVLLPFAQKQQFDFDPMGMLNPQTQWAIAVRDTCLWAFTKSGLFNLIVYAASKVGFKESGADLPKYPWPDGVV